MKLKWKTFDDSWASGNVLLEDFKKRIPNVLSDMGINKKDKEIKQFLTWIKKNVLPFENSLEHSGAIGLYVFSLKKSKI